MKEEILRRQDIFKSMIERELYNLTLSVEDIESIKGNLMTLYKEDVTVLLQKMATECGEIAHENYGGTTMENGKHVYWYDKEMIRSFEHLLR